MVRRNRAGQKGFPARYPDLPNLSIAKINAAIGDGIFKSTASMHVRIVKKITVSHIGSGDGAVLFTGDSVLYQYGPRVQELFNQGRLKQTVYFVAGPSCAPVPGIVRTGGFALCNNLQSIAAHLIAEKHIDTIIIGASWSGYRSDAIIVERHGTRQAMSTQAGGNDFYANLEDEVRHLVRTHHKVYLVLAVPANPRFNPHVMITRSLIGFKVDRNILKGVPVVQLRQAGADINRRLKAIAAATGAETLDPLPDVCGIGPGCSAFFDHDEPKFADGLHLRPGFVEHHIRIFDRILTR